MGNETFLLISHTHTQTDSAAPEVKDLRAGNQSVALSGRTNIINIKIDCRQLKTGRNQRLGKKTNRVNQYSDQTTMRTTIIIEVALVNSNSHFRVTLTNFTDAHTQSLQQRNSIHPVC